MKYYFVIHIERAEERVMQPQKYQKQIKLAHSGSEAGRMLANVSP